MKNRKKTNSDKKKIAKRYLDKYAEFYNMSIEDLNELLKIKMSFTDRLALNDAFYKKQQVESQLKAIENAKKEEQESKIIQTDNDSKVQNTEEKVV